MSGSFLLKTLIRNITLMNNNYSTSKVFVAACAGMGFFGVAMLSLGPILGQLGDGAVSLPSTLSIGIIIGTILFGPVVDRFGYKWLTIISSILALVGLQGLANASSQTALHASILALGLGGGILNGLTNAVVSDIYDDSRRGGRLGVLGAFYCIGALLWTLLNYFIADYMIPLNAMSVVMALFIVYFFFISFPAAKPAENVGLKQTLGLLKYPALIMFAIVLFFQSGFEGASGSFSISYLVDAHSVDRGVATLAMTWFTIGMMAGRFPLGYITSKLKDLGTLYLYLSVALIGVVIFFTMPTVVSAVYLGMALVGFGVGATFPVVLNFIGGAFRNQSGTAFSVAIFIALLGQYTFNKLVGDSFAASNYLLFPCMLIGAIVIIMILVPVAKRISSRMK